jgi:hypothetical protein
MMHSEAKNTRAQSFVCFLFSFGFRVFFLVWEFLWIIGGSSSK